MKCAIEKAEKEWANRHRGEKLFGNDWTFDDKRCVMKLREKRHRKREIEKKSKK